MSGDPTIYPVVVSPVIRPILGEEGDPGAPGPPGGAMTGAEIITAIGAGVYDPAGTALTLTSDLEDTLGSAAYASTGDFATATQGSTADAALPKVAGGASVENIGAVEWNVNTVAATGATETLDTSAYGTHDVTMDQSCTFTFSSPAPSGKETEFKLILRGAFTPTFPAAVDWASASAPTYTTPSVYIFSTIDAGTTWLGFQAGKAFG